jgi:hypothetical protein
VDLDFQIYIDRILSGRYCYRFNNNIFLTKQLNYQDYQIINYKVLEFSKTVKYGYLSNQELLNNALDRRLLDLNYESTLKTMESNLDDLKIELYKYGGILRDSKSLRQRINIIRNSYNTIQNSIAEITELSIENIISNYKLDLILSCIVRNKNHIKIVNRAVQNLQYPLSKIRLIARDYEWQKLWELSGLDLIDCDIRCFDDQQKSFIKFTQLYGKCHEIDGYRPELLDDDDMFDGWLLHISKLHQNKIQNDAVGAKISKANKDADQVFIAAQDRETSKQIYESNTPEAKQILKQRSDALNKFGIIRAGGMPDEQNDIRKKSIDMRKQHG